MTIPFSLERFKAGDVAIFKHGDEFRFVEMPTPHDVVLEILSGSYAGERRVWHPISLLEKTYMKPTTSEGGTEDWIKHDGGPCPIPWAKKGEYEAKRADGLLYSSMIDANEIQSWEEMHIAIETQITDYRLTQGWLPVKGDGTIPAEIAGAKAGEWEFKSRAGNVFESAVDKSSNDSNLFTSMQTPFDIVAVRLVKKEKEDKPRSLKLMRDPNPWTVVIETPQQSLTREALSRFQSSPRGKEFRAQLGHVDTPPPAIGQDAIEGAIFAALCESFNKENGNGR